MVDGSSGSVRTIPFASAFDSPEGASFFQARMRLCGGVLFGLSLAFYVLLNLAYSTLPDHGIAAWLIARGNGWHLAATGSLGAIGLVAHVVPRIPPAALSVMDALLALAPSLAFVMLGLSLAGEWPGAHVALLAVTNVTVARSVLMPSTGRRSLVLTSLAVLPVIALEWTIAPRDGAIPPELRAFAMALWTGVPVVIATVTSAVIYGLRREVAAARQLGQYTLEERIGQGAMGEVHRAHHALLRRPTAVKLVAGREVGEDTLRRFEREVRLTAQLTHPNTISIFDYGRTPDGTLYYAMELLDGFDLETLVTIDGPQEPGRVISLLHQAARALGEAHDAGLIHRDVKPANMILCVRGGEPDVIKVLDFGLVTDLGATADAADHDPELLLGTPHYMAPEAITPPIQVDARTDLYALGAVGYFLLTGSVPFDGASPHAILAKHISDPVDPPSKRLGLPLPDDLERLLLECLEKDRARRPASARELAERLAACADSRSWTTEHARAWWAARGGKVQRAAAPKTAPRMTLDVNLQSRGRVASEPA
jgi:serine/threonine-protein kinase